VDELDPLLHQPLRTQLVAFLAGAGEATFGDLKRRLDVSDGNLDSHLKKLVAAKYLRVRRDDSAVRAQSFFSLTAKGRAALATYVQALQRLLPISTTSGDDVTRLAPASAVRAP
jgi:DNA-binding MarR family transcriptional regulator